MDTQKARAEGELRIAGKPDFERGIRRGSSVVGYCDVAVNGAEGANRGTSPNWIGWRAARVELERVDGTPRRRDREDGARLEGLEIAWLLREMFV